MKKTVFILHALFQSIAYTQSFHLPYIKTGALRNPIETSLVKQNSISKLSIQKFRQKSSHSADSNESIDFATQEGWDTFYKQGNPGSDVHDHDDSNLSFEYEWHSSLPHDLILKQLINLPSTTTSSYLFIGCGNSVLPRQLYDQLVSTYTNDTPNITCMDYSQPCLDILRYLHGDVCPHMKYVCGDATQLSKCLPDNEQYTCIVDKGLIDAFMCCDDWNIKVRSLLQELPSVLDNTEDNRGLYVLMSYKLATSTKEFLIEESGGRLDWTFDIDRMSNDRVSFSIARLT